MRCSSNRSSASVAMENPPMQRLNESYSSVGRSDLKDSLMWRGPAYFAGSESE